MTSTVHNLYKQFYIERFLQLQFPDGKAHPLWGIPTNMWMSRPKRVDSTECRQLNFKRYDMCGKCGVQRDADQSMIAPLELDTGRPITTGVIPVPCYHSVEEPVTKLDAKRIPYPQMPPN